MEKNKFTYDIKNLSCSNCALKIERKIKALSEIEEVNLDFVSKKLTVKTTNNEEILEKLNKIADTIEPGTKFVGIIENDEEEETYIGKAVQLGLGVGLFILAYIFSYFGYFPLLTTPLFILSYGVIGYDVIYKAYYNIKQGNFFDENFLMTIATLAAVYVKSYPEAVAVMLFYEVGELFQDLAVERSRKSIKNLIDIQPKFANLKRHNHILSVEPNSVNINEIIIVKPGEKIPLDGVIISGQSSVDTSQLTGESIPKLVKEGDAVLAGFINYNGLLEIRVTKTYEDSAVSKILELVQNAQSKKARVEKFITRFAKVYTPIVILMAVLIVFIPRFVVSDYHFNDYLYRGATFLVVSCPCALVISIPLSIFGGIGASSRQGILIKGGNYLEALRKFDIIVFDKTGTLTKGNFVVTKVVPFNYDLDRLVEFTIIAESLSNHAIGKAIVNYKKILINEARVKSYEEIFGRGIKARIDDLEIFVGNDKLLKENNIQFFQTSDFGTIIYVAINNKYAGYFVIEDELKPEAKVTIDKLKALGIDKTVMLTGDNENVAHYIGKKLGIDVIYANLLPEDKLIKLEKIKKENPHSTIMFVGDGVNDTPVLMSADIGVAMGALGSDAAIETSDVVIMNDNIGKIVSARLLSQVTHKKIWENIFLALGVKILVLLLTALGYGTMWMAVFSDVGVALLAVVNSILILKFKE